MCTGTPKRIETSIRLHRGCDPRTVGILLATRLDEPDRLAPGSVVDAFCAAVEAGFFGLAAVSDRRHQIAVLRGESVMADLFEATFSRLSPRAFAVLFRMATHSVPGLTRLEIHEQNRDERTLLFRSFERDTEATLREIEWDLHFAPSESLSLELRFRDAPSDAIAAKVAHRIRVFCDVVNLEAYSPPDNEPSTAVLRYVGPGGPRELVAEFEALKCGYDAFEALFGALEEIHEHHPIERVAIPYRADPKGRRGRPTPGAGARSPSVESRGANAHV